MQNTRGLGAQMRLVAGESVQIRQVGSQSSYCSQNTLTEHFGLGDVALVDTLEITWLDGHTQRLTNLPSNNSIQIDKITGLEL